MIRKTSRLTGLGVAISLGLTAPLPAQETDVQTASCGGADVDWIGAGAEGSDIAAADAVLQVQLSASDDAPGRIAFRVGSERQSLRIEAQGNGDPGIALLTADGDLIAENDDTPESLNSRIETNLGPGDYCVALRSVGGEDITATVQVARQDQPALLNETGGGQTIAACMPDTPSAPLAEGALEAAFAGGAVRVVQDGREAGYFRFTLAEPAPVTLRAASDQLDPVIRLYDAAGGLIAENDDADGLNSRLDFPANLMPGDYCLAVAAFSPDQGQIEVSAEKLDRDAFLQAAYRKGEIPPPADAAYPVQQIDLASVGQTVVLQDGAAQWFGFSVEKPTVLIVDAYGALVGVDPKLVLFAANGAQKAENDDHGGTVDARLGPVLLEPGRYSMALTDVNRVNQVGAPMRPVGLAFDIFERVTQPE